MSAFVRGGWLKRLAMAAILLSGAVAAQPGLAQTRTLATLSDVPVYVPAPYHSHIFTSYYSVAPYGGPYPSVGVQYWR